MKSAGERVTAAAAAKRLGLTPQAIGLWGARPDAPIEMVSGRRLYRWPAFARWRETELLKRSRDEAKPEEQAAADLRLTQAKAEMAELDLAERKGALLPEQVVEEVVGETCDKLRAVLVNLSSNYGIELERLGVEPTAAHQVLEQMTRDLTTALRGTADEMDDDAPES